jgi:Ran GTPase-activating protein (RanGAP) involved in mRNA processing and transport
MNMDEPLKLTRTLVSLGMPGNMIDQDIVQKLVKSLILNTSITQIDLSHNLLGDKGARRIAKYIYHSKLLTHINLCDNNVSRLVIGRFIMKVQGI